MTTGRHAVRVQIAAAAAAVVTAATGVVALVTADADASTTRTTSAAQAAAGWLARQLTGSRHDHYAVTFSGQSFADAGETVDGLLALTAAKTELSAAQRITAWLKANAKDYATGSGTTPSNYYPGALAKLLLAAESQYADVHHFGGLDLVGQLRAEEQPDGSFADVADPSYGKGPIDQALALIALSHARSLWYWPDAKSIAWLVGQQCGDGGFTAQTQDAPAQTCDDVDATAYAAQALLTVHSSAAAAAMHWLTLHQNSDGGFGIANGKASSNANSTALALQAEAAAGHTVQVTKALNWLRGHQVRCSGPASQRGAIVFSGKTFAQSTALRATTQAAQALTQKWLGVINNVGQRGQDPVLKC